MIRSPTGTTPIPAPGERFPHHPHPPAAARNEDPGARKRIPHPPPQPKPWPIPRVALIRVHAGERHKAADAGLAALGAAGVPFYQRNRTLVRVCLITAKASDGKVIYVPGVLPVALPVLGRALGQAAKWQKPSARQKLVTIDPPGPVVEQILGMIEEWPFPPLTGVITCPTLRPDGSLLDREGYDHTTGLVLYNTVLIPPINPNPTKEEAEIAIRQLDDELLMGFPFANQASKSVALSKILTPVLRGAFTIAPMHQTSAPLPGSGKSYLDDIASAVVTGERCAVISVAPKAEETEKRLIGAALAAHPIITLDNVRVVLEGDFLCQVTERPLLQLRPLGTSDEVRVANTFTVNINGNNLVVADDLVRRGIRCTLDANTETPETRTFTTNPLAMALDYRGIYIANCLTIARAYIAAGRPDRCPSLPSYEGWSDLVRSALVWLGYDDPVDTMDQIRGADPVRQERADLFTAWREELSLSRAYLAPEIVEIAESTTLPRPKLRAALLAVVSKRGRANEIDAPRFGIWLKKHENTIVWRFKLVADRSDVSRPRWLLKTPP